MDNHAYLRAMARQCFIYRVVHQLKDHVMQAGTVIGITDIHAWPFTHCIKSLQYLDTGGIVIRFAHLETPERYDDRLYLLTLFTEGNQVKRTLFFRQFAMFHVEHLVCWYITIRPQHPRIGMFNGGDKHLAP